MATSTLTRRSGANPAAVEQLAMALRGDLIQPGDPRYDEARIVYNAMIDKHPALIAQCVDAADVIAAVTFAREQGLSLAIRGGGHNGAGLGLVDDGLVIDLSPMNGVRVEPNARTARAQGGATLGDLDHAAHAFGLATPTGIMSTTGVGGLTLGGGLGNLTRPYGLTIDNLLEADVVLADGRLVTASATENSDLFWALRGGGGNFGVVTSFLYRLHPVDTVVAGPTLWPLEQAEEAMRWYREFIAQAPEELNGYFAFLTVPSAAPFPEALWNQKMCGVVWCYTGPPEQADTVFAPVRAFAPPALDGIQAMPFPALQSAFDDLYPPGLQWYWKADYITELPDEAIRRHVAHAAAMPTLHSGMHLYPIDGAAHRPGKHDTAFSYRDARWAETIIGVDPDPANAERITEWARAYWKDLHPYSAGGAYVNMMMEEGDDRVKASYRDNYARLARIKARFEQVLAV